MPKRHDLPEELLEKIGDFSYGGFLLFYIDSEGLPRCDSDFGEAIDAIALQKFAMDWLEAMDKAGKLQMLSNMVSLTSAPEEDENGED